MKRATLISAIAIFGLGGLSAGLGLSLGEAPTQPAPTTTTAAPVDDPCAEYLAQGIACEYVAFPEMDLYPSSGQAVAKR